MQKILKACTTEAASIFTRFGDMVDVSIALLMDKAYVFSEAEMGLDGEFAFERPSLDCIEFMLSVAPFRYHFGETLPARRLRGRSSTVGRPSTLCSTRWTKAGRRGPSQREKTFSEVKSGVFLKLCNHYGLDTSDKELDDEGESKGKEPAPEPSGIGASIMKNTALDFHTGEEVCPWGTAFPTSPEHELLREALGQRELRSGSSNVADELLPPGTTGSACIAPFRSLRSRREGVLDASLLWGLLPMPHLRSCVGASYAQPRLKLEWQFVRIDRPRGAILRRRRRQRRPGAGPAPAVFAIAALGFLLSVGGAADRDVGQRATPSHCCRRIALGACFQLPYLPHSERPNSGRPVPLSTPFFLFRAGRPPNEAAHRSVSPGSMDPHPRRRSYGIRPTYTR